MAKGKTKNQATTAPASGKANAQAQAKTATTAKEAQPKEVTTGTTTAPVPVIVSLSVPSTMTLAEYHDLCSEIREATLNECAVELLDAARYDDTDVVRGVLLAHPALVHHVQQTTDKSSTTSSASTIRSTGQTALHFGAANGHVETCRILVQSGANPMAVNAQGNTPLHWAAANGHVKTVQVLMNEQQKQTDIAAAAADVADADAVDGVPADSASLVLFEIDVLQRNKAGRSILTEGFTSQNHDLVQLLLEHESASEEKLVATSTAGKGQGGSNGDDDEEATQAAVVHEFSFGGLQTTTTTPTTNMHIRELAIATTAEESILGQESPDQDTTGLGIWAAALVTAAWMVAISEKFAGKTVIELGSGCGVPGIALACSSASGGSGDSNDADMDDAKKQRPSKVFLTDFNSRTVENLQHNADLNRETAVPMEVSHMNWQDPATWPATRLDYVIGSDLIYQQDMVPLLVQTVAGILAKTADSRFLYAAPDTGRKGQEGLVTALEDAGLVLLRVQDAPAEYSANPLASQDEEECFLHFNELKSSRFKLYEFAWRDGANATVAP